jgi:aspartyl-tRNA(Asn)/glutamyl-tRNA(Gln) amidotransferase subunit A
MAAYNTAVETLLGLGGIVREVNMPPSELIRPTAMLSVMEAHAYHRDDLIDTPWNFGPSLAQRFTAGGTFFASEMIQAQRMRSLLKEHLRQILLDVDVVLTPTLLTPAPTMEDAAADAARRRSPSYMALWNQVGLPSLSVPSGFSSSGLPLSLQISGRPFDEATVLRAGHAYQGATGWHKRHPDL